jgi:hypothetical protein
LINTPKRLGGLNNLPAILRHQVVDEVVVALPIGHGALYELAECCLVRGTALSIMMNLPPPRFGTWNVDHCGDGTFRMSLTAIPQDVFRLAIKRLMDIAGAAIGLIICGAAYVWYRRRLKNESGASAIFAQRRVGQNGRRFTLYKFRTMYHDADERKNELRDRNLMNGPMFKLAKDPRVTPTGQKLRQRHDI